jgi:hypothetical protein
VAHQVLPNVNRDLRFEPRLGDPPVVPGRGVKAHRARNSSARSRTTSRSARLLGNRGRPAQVNVIGQSASGNSYGGGGAPGH